MDRSRPISPAANWRAALGDGFLLFLVLPFAYFLLYGFHGFADTDQGFVPALSWRVANGQWPYLDFHYVRPPLTPVLHSLEIILLPTKWEVLGMRLVFYLMLWTAVLTGVRTLLRLGDAAPRWPWLLGCLGFVFAAHNFPAMPWHTVDGVFFGALGIWGIGHPRSRVAMVAGLGALALAALAKQPFAILLPAGLVALWLLHGRRMALQATLAFAAASALAAAGVLMAAPTGFLPAMWAHVAGASGGGELLRTGLLAYAWPTLLPVAAGWGLLALGRRWPPLGDRGAAWGLVTGLGLLLLAHVAWMAWKGAFSAPRLGYYHALLWCAAWGCWQAWREGDRRAALVQGLMVALAWASGVSWGYAVPALFALPGIHGFVQVLEGRLGRPLGRGALHGLLAVAAVAYGLMQLQPYRDGWRPDMVTGAGDVFAALGPIRTGPENLAKLQSYKALKARYPYSTVLPAMPAADYLSRSLPATPTDWEHDGEIGAQHLPIVQQALDASGMVVLVEIDGLDDATSPHPAYRCSLLAHVLETWDMVQQDAFFQVFRHPSP